nr:MAG TPA: Protein of unknown function (DUF551) [Crassvirales sp.]
MSVYVTIDLDSLMCKLSNKELYDFMIETFRDRVPDESHVSLITEMFKVMYDTDQEDALAKMVSDMQETRPKQVSLVWVSVNDRLPPVDKEAVVLTTGGEICFGHIVDKKIAKDYNGWNIPDVEYWLPFVDPKDK